MQTVPAKRRSLRKRIAIATAVIAAMLVLSLALVPVIAPMFLYLPTHDEDARQSLLANPDIEPLTVESSGAALTGYFLHGSDDAAPLVLYFNGNHENASACMQALVTTPERLAPFAGCHFAQIDYPSYGLSAGEPSADAYRVMALDVYDALAERADVTEIIVLGYSIGTGPAHYCAAHRPVSGLILFAPYASGVDLFNNIVPVFYGPLEGLVCYDMPSAEYADDIAVEPIIFATPDDHLVPYESTQSLLSLYPAGYKLVTVPDIDHGGFWGSAMVMAAVEGYIDERTAQED